MSCHYKVIYERRVLEYKNILIHIKIMMVPKLVTCLKDYSKEQFIKDFVAGFIVAIIALPLAIALGIASGVSPEKGLFTAIIGGFIISLLGGSRVQIGGPTGAFVIIVFGIIQKYGPSGLIISTIIAGFFLILMGILKFGKVIKYIPYTITTGFTSGIAVTIFSTQISDFLGLTITDVPSEFLDKWICYFNNFNTININTLVIGLVSLLIIIFWHKINKKIPGTLIALLFATFSVQIFGLNVETIGSRFGSISASLPHITFPNITFELISELVFPGFTIAVLAGIESLLSAVVADGMIGGKHRSNMELVAQGVANIFSALFGGIPVTGAIARTAANVKNGGRTPVAGIVHSITLLIIMLLFMPYVKLIPMTCLAAILIMVSYNMGEWESFKMIKTAPKSDTLVFLTTFFLTIFLDLVVAIGVGMVLASFLFMQRMSEVTDVKCVLGEEEEEPKTVDKYKMNKNTLVYEIDGPFFFGAADKFISAIREIDFLPKVLIIDMAKVPIIDITAYHALEMIYDICKKHSTKIIVAGLQEQPLKVLNKNNFIELIKHENIFENVEKAIQKENTFEVEN